jgi:hypothetical protein
LTENFTPYSAPDDKGRTGRTIPDAMARARGSVEVKRSRHVYNSRQLQRQFNLAESRGGRHRVIVRPEAHVTKQLVARARKGGHEILRAQGGGIFSRADDPGAKRPLVYDVRRDRFKAAPPPPPPPDDGDGGEGNPCLMAVIGAANPCGDSGWPILPHPDTGPVPSRPTVPIGPRIPIPLPIP